MAQIHRLAEGSTEAARAEEHGLKVPCTRYVGGKEPCICLGVQKEGAGHSLEDGRGGQVNRLRKGSGQVGAQHVSSRLQRTGRGAQQRKGSGERRRRGARPEGQRGRGRRRRAGTWASWRRRSPGGPALRARSW